MRWLIKKILFHLLAIVATVKIIPGFSVGNSAENIAIATVALTVINVFIKPIVKILFLPLNLITLNLFTIVINTGIIVALTKFVSTVTIASWHFNGINYQGFVIPALDVTVIFNYIIIGILITTIVNFLNWLD